MILDRLEKVILIKPLKLGFIASVVAMIYFGFIETQQFQSSSMIKIKESSPEINLEFQLLSSASNEIYELSSFLKSEELFEKLIDHADVNGIKNLMNGNLLDLRKNYSGNKKDYLKNFIRIQIDDFSGVMTINTFAFSPQNAYFLNQSLLAFSQFYFDRKQMVTSEIAATNSICNLNGYRNGVEMDHIFDSNYQFNFSENRNILLELVNKRREQCESKFLAKNLDDESNTKMPSQISEQVLSQQEKTLLSDFLINESQKSYISDKLIIVSNPNKPDYPLPKRLILKIVIIFLITVVLRISLAVVLAILRD